MFSNNNIHKASTNLFFRYYSDSSFFTIHTYNSWDPYTGPPIFKSRKIRAGTARADALLPAT